VVPVSLVPVSLFGGGSFCEPADICVPVSLVPVSLVPVSLFGGGSFCEPADICVPVSLCGGGSFCEPADICVFVSLFGPCEFVWWGHSPEKVPLPHFPALRLFLPVQFTPARPFACVRFPAEPIAFVLACAVLPLLDHLRVFVSLLNRLRLFVNLLNLLRLFLPVQFSCSIWESLGSPGLATEGNPIGTSFVIEAESRGNARKLILTDGLPENIPVISDIENSIGSSRRARSLLDTENVAARTVSLAYGYPAVSF